MLLDNIVTVVDYGLYVYVFFSLLLLCYFLGFFSTVIDELKITRKVKGSDPTHFVSRYWLSVVYIC